MNVTFIIIGIVILGIILSLVYIPRITSPRRLDSLFKFLLTLLATLAGVFLAFQISNYQEVQNEKDFIAGLLDESAYEFGLEINCLEEDYLSFIDNKQDIIESEELVKAPPLHTIVSLEIVINSTLLSKFGSSSYTEIHTVKHEIDGIRMSVNSPEVDPNVKLALIKSYVQWCSHMRELLLIESSYIRGNISADEVSRKYEKLITEFSLQ
ncbi:hypothetical protein ACFLVO_04770 [Chloroflexota bacterium]